MAVSYITKGKAIVKVNSQQLLDNGFIILREVVPKEQLEDLRASYEILIDRLGGQNWMGSRKICCQLL